MALVNCNDCGTEISTKAVSCPKCGSRCCQTNLASKLEQAII